MRSFDIEARAFRIVDRVNAGQAVEDALVEIKSACIEPDKAARRIAAMANAARGEPVLWIVGVDEKAATVPGVPASEFASWWQRVERRFDEVTPSIAM